MALRDGIVFEPPEMGCVLSLTGLPGGGSKIYDRSPYGNIGTITGATWKRLPSGLWCPSFDGVDDYVSLGAGRFDTLSQATIEFWYRPDIDLDSQATHRDLFTFYKDSNNFIIGYYSHTQNCMRLLGLVSGTDVVVIPASGGAGESQEWHYWTCVLGTGGAELWIDCSSQGTDTNTECIADVAATTANYIGALGASDQPWSGDIALFRIHNRRLSAAEIQNHFNQEKHLFAVW